MKILLAVFALVGLACADDFTLTDGTEYKDVRVRRVEPDGLVIVTVDGIIKIPFSKLSEVIQKKYNFDASAAGKFASDSAAKTADLDRKAREQESNIKLGEAEPPPESTLDVKLTVMQVVNGGFLASGYIRQPYGPTMKFTDDIFVEGEIPGLVDNAKLSAVISKAGTKRFTSVLGSERTLAKFRLISVSEIETTESPSGGVSSTQRIGGG